MPTTIAKPLSSVSLHIAIETLKPIVTFCLAGLTLSLLCALCGLDLGAGLP
jgi:hypothetical protein